MEQRRLGRLGHSSSVLIYGAAALAGVDQDTADLSIQAALDAGLNHFDTARDYGEAEVRLGPWMSRIRSDIFLASKTGERGREAAWRQINESLERLQTDRLDLIQLHAVCDLENLDAATGSGGALESAIRARDEGLATAIGITGHGHEAPAVHLEALRRFDFDTVLTPLNYALGRDEMYYAAFRALVAETSARDVGLMVIKSVARRNWPDEARPYTTWYEPWDDQDTITAAASWVLDHLEVCGIATPGEVRLLPQVIRAEQDRASMPVERRTELLDAAEQYSSPFLATP